MVFLFCEDWRPRKAGGLSLGGAEPGPDNQVYRLLLLLLLSRFSHVRLCATPKTAAWWLPRPWDSPGKNTGVGYHFLLQRMKVESESEIVQLCLTLRDPMDCSLPGFSIHGIFQEGKNTGVGCHFLLQEIFPTQGLNPSLLHCRQTLYCLRHQESPLAGWYKPLTGFLP